MNENDLPKASEIRWQRRQFLANLLFAGGVVSLAGLQSAQAQTNPTDGWTLPDLNTPSPRQTPKPPPKPPKPPRPPLPGKPIPPQPPTAGVPLPPNPRGRVVLPGDVVCPPPPGSTTPPQKR